MQVSDQIALYTAIFTGLAALATVAGFIYAWMQYLRDQHQQRAAQTRAALQAIVGTCSQFLRPMSEQFPYPILHTATAISKEFCPRMKPEPDGTDVQALLSNKDLLLSICVEGWINSTQIFRMLSIAEELERQASSRFLRGRLLLMCDASFWLAGLVALICSPNTFYEMLLDVELNHKPHAPAEEVLNLLTVKLQQCLCKQFDDHYKNIIILSLHFIQTAAAAFMNLPDPVLLELATAPETHPKLSVPLDSPEPTPATEAHAELSVSPKLHDKQKQIILVLKHFAWVETLLNGFNHATSRPRQ